MFRLSKCRFLIKRLLIKQKVHNCITGRFAVIMDRGGGRMRKPKVFFTCSSIQNVQLKKVCAALMKKLRNAQVCYLVAQECKKVNSSKHGGFRYEMIGETRLEMELLEVVAFYQPLFDKSREFNPVCNQNLILQHST